MQWFVLLGIVTGMRTMTAIACVCWFAYLGLLPQTGWSFWTASLVSVIVFTLAALGEYVGDVLPQTPSRTAAGPLGARLVFGMLVGLLATHAMGQPAVGGVLFGLAGALIGAFGGRYVRGWASAKAGKDWPIGVTESIFALALALLALRFLHHDYLLEVRHYR